MCDCWLHFCKGQAQNTHGITDQNDHISPLGPANMQCHECRLLQQVPAGLHVLPQKPRPHGRTVHLRLQGGYQHDAALQHAPPHGLSQVSTYGHIADGPVDHLITGVCCCCCAGIHPFGTAMWPVLAVKHLDSCSCSDSESISANMKAKELLVQAVPGQRHIHCD